MSSVLVRARSPEHAPDLPSGEIPLEAPPDRGPPQRMRLVQQLWLLVMVLIAAGAAVTDLLDSRADGLLRAANVGLAVVVIGLLVSRLERGGLGTPALRRDYLRYLSHLERRARQVADAQREALEWTGPDPRSLWSVAMSSLLWERRPSGQNFANVRIGTGTQRLAVRLVPPETKPIEDLDQVCAAALRQFIQAFSTVPNLPVVVALRSFARMVPEGQPEVVLGMVRALIAQLAVFHSPDDVRICVCASPERMRWWEWIKWLPHNMHPGEADAAGPVRLMATSLPQLEALLGYEFAERPRFAAGRSTVALPFYVVIVDGGSDLPGSQLGSAGVDGAIAIDLTPAAANVAGPPLVEDADTEVAIDLTSREASALGSPVLRLNVSSGGTEILGRDRYGGETRTPVGAPDWLSLAEADALARQVAPLRPVEGRPESDPLSADTTLTSLLGMPSPFALDVAGLWRPRAPRDLLRVPIGTDAGGKPVELDIKESAQGGMGPHGLLIGATGSGKSELLRTLVLGMALTHPPDVLNFVLVDFKGGATFSGLAELHHVSALISNLADDLPLADRMYDTLTGELVRRQELLRAAGNFASLRDYHRARAAGADLPPAPTLFVIIDEFSELLSARPTFIDLFVQIGRLGRSLGVHLLLASQRLEEGRLRGLDTHLSYRIGLRTFSAAESRLVLGVPDAYELPLRPGNGYLKTGAEGTTRFKAAHVSGPAAATGPQVEQRQARRMIVPFGPGYIPPEAAEEDPPGSGQQQPETSESLLDVVVAQLAQKGPVAHQIWLPPLDVPPTLDQLLPPLSVTSQYGLSVDDPGRRGQLRAVTGIVDRPFDQRRDPLSVDLSAAAGHAAVVGGPRAGKSTTLQALISSLSLLHTPAQVQFYSLDFGGGSLAGLTGLPHVGGVASRLDAARVRRTVAEVEAVLTRREHEFAEQGIESIDAYRRMVAAGEIAGDGFGDVFLVVDGWLTLRQEFEELEQTVTSIAARGLGYGVHVIAAASKWSEFRPAVRDLFGTRLELRLGDPYESEVDRRTAANVPENAPGRGLTRNGLHFLTALPRIDSVADPASLADGLRAMTKAVASAWQRPPAPRVRVMPPLLQAAALPSPAQAGHPIPIGLDETTLSPVLLDFEADAHFLVFGDTECGKSNLLRLIADGITARYTPEQARVIFVDYRRSLLDSAESPLQIGYAAAGASAVLLINDSRAALAARLPTADLTPAQLRDRSWWKGPDLFLIIDDYHLLAGVSNPLLPIADLIPQARDIGLHVILARAAAGAGRAMFDPLIQRIREMGSSGLIMSGSKDEGTLLGNVRAQAQPPGRGFLVERRAGSRLIQVALAGEDRPADGE